MDVLKTNIILAIFIFIGRFIEKAFQRIKPFGNPRLGGRLNQHAWNPTGESQLSPRRTPATAWEKQNGFGLSEPPVLDEHELRDIEKAEEYNRQLGLVNEIFADRISGVTVMLDGERKAYNAARKAISVLRLRNWQVHAQVAMGEFIETGYRNAKHTFNSKRVDLLICDENVMPRLVVEHQGDGHIKKLRNASGEIFDSLADTRRNEVKKTVLEKAGIPLVETQDDDSAEATYIRIEQALSKISAADVKVRRKSIEFDE